MAESDKKVDILMGVRPSSEAAHSVFSKWQCVTYVYIASLAAFTSPVASNIYLPAMLSIARDLNVSSTRISLTVTVYMVRHSVFSSSQAATKQRKIFEGIAPTVVSGLSDRAGRRPAYLLSFTLFIASSIGLALQSNYATLLVLRCVQSSGASGTAVLSSVIVSDVATKQERGSFIGLSALGNSMGPALGPIVGGLLTHFLGWRSVFWFLAIYGSVMLLVFTVFIPETCHNVVGDGPLPAQSWNRPLIACLPSIRPSLIEAEATTPERSAKKRPGLLATIPIILSKESFLFLFFGGLVYAGYYVVLVSLPQQLTSTYHYNSIQVGLCSIPIGVRPMLVRPIIGRIMDANFRRYARKLGLEVVKNKQHDIDGFPIEWARLQISLILVYLSSAVIIP